MTLAAPNSQYNVMSPDSLAARIVTYQRRRMYEKFISLSGVTGDDTILDVGVTSDQTFESSNYLEAWYPNKRAITAAGKDDASFLRRLYPGMRFVFADGLDLPFADRSFDVVHSSAVLEHVGRAANQRRFIGECCRVARRAVFMTTPNRWFPVEFHTTLPLVHWLPKPTFRSILRGMGSDFLADEQNLNLMTAGELLAAARAFGSFSSEVFTVSLAGWPSNLLLSMHRREP